MYNNSEHHTSRISYIESIYQPHDLKANSLYLFILELSLAQNNSFDATTISILLLMCCIVLEQLLSKKSM